MIQTVLKLYHDSQFAAHSGIQVTINRIKENYFFNRLSQIVSEYVRSCDQYQSSKIIKVSTRNDIVAYPTPQEPFQYGVLPITNHGIHIFLQLLICFPSCWNWICALCKWRTCFLRVHEVFAKSKMGVDMFSSEVVSGCFHSL